MYSAIAENKRKTWLIMAGFVILVGMVGAAVSIIYSGDLYITPFVFAGALIYALFSYYGASKMAVAMTGATEITQADEPRLYKIVENLSISTGIPTPKIYVIEDEGLNAFATGRDPNHAIVAATRGLLNALDDPELEGVMAHELGHVRNYDIRVAMIAMGLSVAIALVADVALRGLFWGGGNRNRKSGGGSNAIVMIIAVVAIVLAPIISALIRSAVSRQREYLADASGAETTRYPEGLASALEKLGGGRSKLKKQSSATAHLFISSPLDTKSFSKMFSTHPPIEDRVKRLRGIGSSL